MGKVEKKRDKRDEVREDKSSANHVLKSFADWKEEGGRLPKFVRPAFKRVRKYWRGRKAKEKRLTKSIRKLLAEQTGADAAVKEARKRIGETENPAGSNWGGFVTRCILYLGYTFPVPWCGCFVGWCAVKKGKARIPNRLRLGYTPYIVADARAGANGLRDVPVGDAKPGDLVVFHFGSGGAKHVGLCVGKTRDGLTHTIEGNTSPGDGGSQANGGGVFERRRPISHVICVARPDYS